MTAPTHPTSHIPHPTSRRLIAGCMTGTSIDSLDAALVQIEGAGLGMRARVLRGLSRPLGPLASRLRALADQHPMTAGEIASLSREFSLLHADAIRELAASDPLDLACIHGQTIFHAPPVSWQLLTPAPIARALNAPVVFDLRAADLAAGGQGAPITPLADWILFDTEFQTRTVVNLGGFCNITLLPGVPAFAGPGGPAFAVERISGRDVCACNQLLDAIARRRLNSPYDESGKTASAGTVRDGPFSAFRELLIEQSRTGRSLGTGDELGTCIDRFAEIAATDLARSAAEAIASVICDHAMGTLILAGGGARNAALAAAIRALSHAPVTTTDTFGIPIEFREAACFAILGALCQDRVPITLPQVTGVAHPAPISGAWVYP